MDTQIVFTPLISEISVPCRIPQYFDLACFIICRCWVSRMLLHVYRDSLSFKKKLITSLHKRCDANLTISIPLSALWHNQAQTCNRILYFKIFWYVELFLCQDSHDFWAPSQYPIRRLSVRSHKVSKLLDLYLELPMCLSNFKAIQQFKVPISWLRDFTRSYDKTSFRILRRGPGLYDSHIKYK